MSAAREAGLSWHPAGALLGPGELAGDDTGPIAPAKHPRHEPTWQRYTQPHHQGRNRLPASHLYSCLSHPRGAEMSDPGVRLVDRGRPYPPRPAADVVAG